jgi:hypothetical protein
LEAIPPWERKFVSLPKNGLRLIIFYGMNYLLWNELSSEGKGFREA